MALFSHMNPNVFSLCPPSGDRAAADAPQRRQRVDAALAAGGLPPADGALSQVLQRPRPAQGRRRRPVPRRRLRLHPRRLLLGYSRPL